MPVTSLGRRLSRVTDRLTPRPDPAFLAYARAIIAWGGSSPNEADAIRFARDLAGTRGGATWEGLVELAGESLPDATCYRPPPEHTTDRDTRLQ